MKVLIAGASGYIGQKLVPHLKMAGFQVAVVGRQLDKLKLLYPVDVTYFGWDIFSKEAAERLSTFDVVINLAGTNIDDQRWSDAFQADVMTSRIKTTEQIVGACLRLKESSPALLNASAVSIYGLGLDETEELARETDCLNFYEDGDFIEELAKAWERVTWPLRDHGVRVVNLRFGVVLDAKSKVFKALLLPYRLFAGGVIGAGTQGLSWIARTDAVRAIAFLLAHPEVIGPVNIVAPQPLSYKDLADAIGSVTKRSNWLAKPAWLMRKLLGKDKADSLLLKGVYAYPSVLLQAGFSFKIKSFSQLLLMVLKPNEDR